MKAVFAFVSHHREDFAPKTTVTGTDTSPRNTLQFLGIWWGYRLQISYKINSHFAVWQLGRQVFSGYKMLASYS